jgi:dipeptidyl aminopeptidase/acylaminoacyl peptidase
MTLRAFAHSLLLAGICWLSSPTLSLAQQPAAVTPGGIVTLRSVSDPQTSPDGKRVLFVLSHARDSTATAQESGIWLTSTTSQQRSEPLPVSADGDFSPRWSPSGSVIAFLSARAHGDSTLNGTTQIYTSDASGRSARRLTSVRTGVSSFSWSPDGRFIAFVAPDTAAPPRTRSDAIIYNAPARLSRIWMADVATRNTRQITTDNFDVREVVWSPDGRELAAVTAPSASNDDMFHLSVVAIDRSTGKVARVLNDNATGVGGALRWSPDGRWITFFENSPKKGAFWLAAVPASGGEVRGVLKDMPVTVLAVEWMKDSAEPCVLVIRGTHQEILRVDMRTGAYRKLADVLASQGTFALSTNGRDVVYTNESATSPADIWLLDANGKSFALTNLNPHARAWRLGAVRDFHWKNTRDGLALDGVLVLPPDYVAGKRYPTVVQTHPGDLPWWTGWIGTWWAWGQLLGSHGYVVFMPNYRGVNGYGWQLKETLGDWGEMALHDLLDGVDALVREGIADPERLGIGGWSNGGFMTEWTITHTNRFKAAVAEAAHSDMFSLYGTSQSAPPFLRANFGSTPYVNRAQYDAHSPIAFVDSVRTPTLLLHGQNDRGVPLGQAQEFYRALLERGVETQLVVYPREGHGISELPHRTDLQARVLEWFDRHLK